MTAHEEPTGGSFRPADVQRSDRPSTALALDQIRQRLDAEMTRGPDTQRTPPLGDAPDEQRRRELERLREALQAAESALLAAESALLDERRAHERTRARTRARISLLEGQAVSLERINGDIGTAPNTQTSGPSGQAGHAGKIRQQRLLERTRELTRRGAVLALERRTPSEPRTMGRATREE